MFIAAATRIAGIVEAPFGEFTRPGWRIYPEKLAGESYGAGLLAAAAVGVWVIVRGPSRAALVAWAGVLLFGGVLFAILVAAQSGYPHFLMPLVPVLALLSARGIVSIAQRLRWPAWGVLAVALLPTAPHLARGVVSAAFDADTRLIALELIESRVPAGRQVVVVGGERGLPPLAEKGAPPLMGLAWINPAARLSREDHARAREVALELQSASAIPKYSVWRIEPGELTTALEKSHSAAAVIFNRESVKLPADLAAEYEPHVVRPGPFREGRPILVLLRKADSQSAGNPLAPSRHR